MRKLFSKPNLLILLFILAIGIYLRTFEIIGRFNYDHDQDLYSWIFKDIVVNHHLRLIGQLTSAPGIFIGPLFYYLITPFILLTKMDPIGAVIPITIIGILTILSYFIVLGKIFNDKVGLIGAFLYAILLNNIPFDRRIVPSTLTNIWSIWYFYCVIMIARGNYQVLPILGILIGLIWHIHIALLPALIAIPAAIIVSKKIPTKKQVVTFLITLTITSIPLMLFELRHNFQQILAIFHNFTTSSGSSTGLYKLQLVLQMVSKNLTSLIFAPVPIPSNLNILVFILVIFSAIWLLKQKLLSKKEVIIFYAWIAGVIGFFSISSSLISEYYFYNIEVIFTTLLSLILFTLYKSSKYTKTFALLLLFIILVKNLYSFTTDYIYHKGYVERKAVASFITSDANEKGYPCVGISYITAIGENVGFRYFFYLNNLKLTHPSTQVPVYNIVLPDELSPEVGEKFGHIGVITPKNKFDLTKLQDLCKGENTNLTDPMFGYTE